MVFFRRENTSPGPCSFKVIYIILHLNYSQLELEKCGTLTVLNEMPHCLCYNIILIHDNHICRPFESSLIYKSSVKDPLDTIISGTNDVVSQQLFILYSSMVRECNWENIMFAKYLITIACSNFDLLISLCFLCFSCIRDSFLERFFIYFLCSCSMFELPGMLFVKQHIRSVASFHLKKLFICLRALGYQTCWPLM